jgi:hypothetical protein
MEGEIQYYISISSKKDTNPVHPIESINAINAMGNRARVFSTGTKN